MCHWGPVDEAGNPLPPSQGESVSKTVTMEPPVDWEQFDPDEWVAIDRTGLALLRAEVERLRAALENYDRMWQERKLHYGDAGDEDSEEAERIARAALEGEAS